MNFIIYISTCSLPVVVYNCVSILQVNTDVFHVTTHAVSEYTIVFLFYSLQVVRRRLVNFYRLLGPRFYLIMSTSVSTDTLPANVPKLKFNGSNWAIFQTRFKLAMGTKEKWGHFDGSQPRPLFLGNTLTTEQVARLEEWEIGRAHV